MIILTILILVLFYLKNLPPTAEKSLENMLDETDPMILLALANLSHLENAKVFVSDNTSANSTAMNHNMLSLRIEIKPNSPQTAGTAYKRTQKILESTGLIYR